MSVLKDLASFDKAALKKTDTRVTRADGSQEVESLSTGQKTAVHSRTAGFVQDLAPDLKVGCPLQGLFIGSQDAASSWSVISENGISHVLNVATGIKESFRDGHDITYLTVEVLDVPEENIRQHFQRCFEFIDDARKVGGVLVHCNAGVSRSATIVIAYLMQNNRMSFQAALNKVRETRWVQPNTGFVKQLLDYEKDLKLTR